MMPMRSPRAISTAMFSQRVFGAEGFAELADLEDAVAGALGGVEGEIDALLHADALDHFVAFEQAVEAGFAALGFLAALAGLEAADEFLLLGDVLLLDFVGALPAKVR